LTLAPTDHRPPLEESHTVPTVEGFSQVVEVEKPARRIEAEPPNPSEDDAYHRQHRGLWRRYGLFVFSVVLPMAVAAGVLLFVFSPRYGSTASFIVRSTDKDPSQILIAQLDPAIATTVAIDETNAIDAYLNSRQFVDELAKDDHLREILSRRQADFVFRYPTFWLPDNKEFLFQRFRWMATAKVDPETYMTTIEVNAFTPKDAQALAQAMLAHAEALVNRMNERYYQTQAAVVDRYIAEAQKDLDAVEADLKAFRNGSGSVDPNLVAQTELNVAQGLTTQLAQIEATISHEHALKASSAQLAGLRAQAQSYRDQIHDLMLQIAGASGSEGAKLRTYDLLALRLVLAVQELTDAAGQRDQAQQDAARQHLYVQRITQPSLELDWARYPQITLDLLILLALCLGIFLILRSLRGFALEHRP
jgi:capsular polysaccharide transport system permease protein